MCLKKGVFAGVRTRTQCVAPLLCYYMYYTSRGTIWTGVALSLGYVSKTGDLLGGGVSIPPFIDNVLFIFCVHLSFVHRHMCRHYIREVKENGGVKKSSIF